MYASVDLKTGCFKKQKYITKMMKYDTQDHYCDRS